MDLQEKIARLIDPDAWRLLDQHREEHPDLDERPPSRFTIESREAARRVIDGLGLTEQTRTMCDGLMPNGRDTYGDTIEHRLVTPWEDQ